MLEKFKSWAHNNAPGIIIALVALAYFSVASFMYGYHKAEQLTETRACAAKGGVLVKSATGRNGMVCVKEIL